MIAESCGKPAEVNSDASGENGLALRASGLRVSPESSQSAQIPRLNAQNSKDKQKPQDSFTAEISTELALYNQVKKSRNDQNNVNTHTHLAKNFHQCCIL